MTISAGIFAEGLGLLSARWRQEPPPAIQAVMLEYLDAQLDDHEYVAGVKSCIAELEFYPTAKQIVDRGRAPVDIVGDAGQVFSAIYTQGATYQGPELGTRYSPAAIEERWGTLALKAFNALGGVGRWNGMTDRDVPFARREFVEAYAGLVELERAGQVFERLSPPRDPAKECGTPAHRTAQLKQAADARIRRDVDRINDGRKRLGLPMVAMPASVATRAPSNGLTRVGDILKTYLDTPA